jgi:hypothetical protein
MREGEGAAMQPIWSRWPLPVLGWRGPCERAALTTALSGLMGAGRSKGRKQGFQHGGSARDAEGRREGKVGASRGVVSGCAAVRTSCLGWIVAAGGSVGVA